MECEKKKIWHQVGRSVYLHVDLDRVTNNIQCVRRVIKNKRAMICAMVKGNGYGHGAVEISRHLKCIGVERLGVATVAEGVQLREAGIRGPIHLMGNVQSWEMVKCLEHRLIATVSSREAIIGMAEALNNRKDVHALNHVISMEEQSPQDGAVHIKIDTGMSRNGCQPEELAELVALCEELNVPLEGMYTHFADFENESFTQSQKDAYYSAIKPYRSRDFIFHMSNSGGIVSGNGSELDMVRPGICVYGLPPGDDVEGFQRMGFQPIGALKGSPTLVKQLPAGRAVGYGCSYITDGHEWVATFPIGYGDGYFRSLSNKGFVIRDKTGERCPIVGRVSMDAVTFQTSEKTGEHETFTLISSDFDPETSATGIADQVDTINYEVTTRLAPRVPRLYTSSQLEAVVDKLAA